MSRIRVAVLAVMAAVLALALVAACGDDAGSDSTASDSGSAAQAATNSGAKEFTFFSVYHTFPHPFWLMMQRAANFAGEQTNTEVDFWIGTEYSVEDQINRVEVLTAKNPDGMAVSIPDAKAADPVYRAAIDAGIPLVAVNARDPRSKGERIPYLFYVGSNEIIAGNRTAEEILERFGQPTRVAFASAQIANIAITERALGVQQILEPLGVTVDLVDVSDDPTLGTETVKGWMSANPETDYWVCGSAICQSVVTDALKELGLLNNGVTVTGFDLGEVVTPLIRDGSVKFTIDQQPYLQGYLPIVWLYLYNKAGFLPAGDVLTGPAIVDSNNIELVAELADKFR